MARQHADKPDKPKSAVHGAEPKSRKDRIDDALKAFDASASSAAGVVSPEGGAHTTIPSSSTPADRPKSKDIPAEPKKPKHEPAKPEEQPAKARANERDFIMEHANEALEVLTRKKPKAPANDLASETIAPTNPDPESALLVAAAEKERARVEAEAAANEKKFDVTPAHFQEHQFNRRPFIVLACLWLAAVPVAMILYAVAYGEDGASSAVIGRLTTLITYILGAYGLLGWIPLVLLYMRRRNT